MQNQMYAKSVIVFHHFKWPSEVSYPVVPNGKKKTLMEKKKKQKATKNFHVLPCVRAFLCYFLGAGLSVNES